MMNYIKLIHAAYTRFYDDERLNPTHISLYMALFQEWNSTRFREGFYVSRGVLMRIAKLGSKTTYHRCMTDLNDWGYLTYLPSNNPYKGSVIKMTLFETSDEPVVDGSDTSLEQLAEHYHPTTIPQTGHYRPANVPVVGRHRPVNGQALVSTTNNTKHANNIKQPKDFLAVLDFFEEQQADAAEAEKFHDHYQATNWEDAGGKPVRDWQALALSWIQNKKADTGSDNLRTVKNKDYGKPL
tara:strand:- start:5025 stop:5744 length:720 start_codon:yes stop_codon:yes gene_type:complete